jgi:hypothetical protein
MEAVGIKDLLYVATIIFAAGGVYYRLGSLEKMFVEFRSDIRLTLFGQDGRNGVVGDVAIVKAHTDHCKQNRAEHHG